jgi:hypothetical protein
MKFAKHEKNLKSMKIFAKHQKNLLSIKKIFSQNDFSRTAMTILTPGTCYLANSKHVLLCECGPIRLYTGVRSLMLRKFSEKF